MHRRHRRHHRWVGEVRHTWRLGHQSMVRTRKRPLEQVIPHRDQINDRHPCIILNQHRSLRVEPSLHYVPRGDMPRHQGKRVAARSTHSRSSNSSSNSNSNSHSHRKAQLLRHPPHIGHTSPKPLVPAHRAMACPLHSPLPLTMRRASKTTSIIRNRPRPLPTIARRRTRCAKVPSRPWATRLCSNSNNIMHKCTSIITLSRAHPWGHRHMSHDTPTTL
jgi:hypothetical protein